MASINERRIRDVRDIWNAGARSTSEDKENPTRMMVNNNMNNNNNNVDNNSLDNRTKHKYKTLERHLSMKKTIRKKMMRDLREIGDGTTSPHQENQSQQHTAFLEQIKNDQPPPENIEKPSLWKRLTKGWSH